MATILRSSKYIRCLNILTRRTVVGRNNVNFASKCLILQAQCINSYLTKSYATISAVQGNTLVDGHRDLLKLDDSVRRYGRVYKDELKQVFFNVQNAGKISSSDGLFLIHCCGELMVDTLPNERNQLVKEIWDTLKMLNTPLDVSHFNALLKVYLENNYEFMPIEILTEMKKKMIEPNRVTYQRFISNYCKKGDIQGATEVLEVMRDKGVPLNENIFNALITGYSEANDMESANNILNVMKDAGIVSGSNTYTALLCAYAKRGDMDTIRNIMKECEAKELFFYDKQFFEIIHVLAANGYNTEIDEILSIMPKGPNYNFEALQGIHKIIDVGKVDAALKILPTVRKNRRISNEESDDNHTGTFLIRKLVNSKFPITTVTKVCDQLEKQQLHSRAYFIALERSLINGDTVLGIPLLKAYKERGGDIREHYVWPLLVANGKASNFEGVQDVIKLLIHEFNVMPSTETLSDYVLPYTVGRWGYVIGTLMGYGIPQTAIANAMAMRMLRDNKIRQTALFMTTNPLNYEAGKLLSFLADAVKKTGDAQSFAIILRLQHEAAINRSESSESVGASEEGLTENSSDLRNENVIDAGIRKVIAQFSLHNYSVMNEILDRLIESGMSLSPEVGEQLRQYFQSKLTPETSEKIDKLTSGTLVLTPISKFMVQPDDNDEISIGSREGILGSFANERQQLAWVLGSNDIAAVKKLIEKMESKGFLFSPALYCQIIDVFCSAKDMEQAEIWMNKFKSAHPESTTDLQKSTNYAQLLIKNGRFDDAVQFILDSPRKGNAENHGQSLRNFMKTLLNIVADTGDVEKTNKLFDALVAANFIIIDNYMLGPLVKVHLVKDDMKGALDAFENACHNHGCTPMKNELARKIIDAEDANSLQRLTDLSSKIHGESNSLIDLVLSFIECGRFRQARKILETPGLKLRSEKFRSFVLRYTKNDNIETLEHFVDISKDIKVFDRQELYDILLEKYSDMNKWQCGLNLWIKMEDEDLRPSQTFKNTLAQLLAANNQPIPFAHDVNENEEMLPPLKYVLDFNKAMEQGDLYAAEKIVHNAPRNDTNFCIVASKLIQEILEQRKDVDKAYEITEMMISKYARLPLAGALKHLWHHLIEAGKFNKLRSFNSMLSVSMKKKFRFNKFLNRMTLKELGLREYLTKLEAQITDSRKDNFILVKDHMHFGTLLDEFRQDPTALTQFMPLATKLADRQIYMPMNVAWCSYFEQNKPEADEIWTKYLSDKDNITVTHLFKNGTDGNNVEIVERLYRKFEDNKVKSIKLRAIVVSALIKAYNKDGRYDDALKVLQDTPATIAQQVNMEDPTSIEELKKGLLANNKSLPSHLEVKQ